jgi:hypothetical protein
MTWRQERRGPDSARRRGLARVSAAGRRGARARNAGRGRVQASLPPPGVNLNNMIERKT